MMLILSDTEPLLLIHMNWLMWGKMFTYFCNKFMPVNHMHCIKCAVNSSLLTLLWLLQKVCGTLDPCFITAHSIHKEGDLQIYFGVIFHIKCSSNRPTSHLVHLYTVPFFGRDKQTDSSPFVWMISLATVCYGPQVAKHFLHPQSALQPIWGWGDLGSFQLPQSTSVYPKVPGQCF